MKVAQVMSREGLACTSPHESLHRAARLLWDQDCGVVPVVQDGIVVAMLTDRDICMAAFTQNHPLTDIQVSTAMSRHVFACGPDDDVEQAMGLMRKHQVRRVPVVDARRHLVGLLSQSDLVREAVHKRLPARDVVETLSGIGEKHRLVPLHAPTPAVHVATA